MPLTKPIVSIENVVASASINQKLDLDKIRSEFPDVEYHPMDFPAAIFRLASPKTATLLFSSGKMVCTGSKSEKTARKAVGKVVELLRTAIDIEHDADVTIQNIVCAVNLGGRISIESAVRSLPRSIYEPDQFPGLIHRMLDPKTSVLLFSSGKLVCAGARTESEVYRSIHQIHSILEEKNLMIYE